jgi:WD40 repeat protein
VFCVAVSHDRKLVALGCFDGSIRLWDVVSCEYRAELKGHKFSVRSVAFSPDGTLLASAGGDYRNREGSGEVKIWDLAGKGRNLRELKGHTALVWSVAFSPDGKTLATGSWDKTARLWDPATGETRAVLEGHTDGVRFVAFAPLLQRDPVSPPECPLLATAGFDGDVKLWDVAPGQPRDGKLSRSYHASDFGLSGVAISPDFRTLAISPRPSFTEVRPDEVILLDLETGKERARLKGHRQGIISVAFSPDGKTLASGGGIFEDPESTGEVFLWDVASGRIKARFVGLKYWVESVVFTPDGSALISGGGVRDTGGEVRFWDPIRLSPASTPARVHRFPGKRIWSLAYSPDGTSVALGCGVHTPGASGFGDDRGVLGVFQKDRALVPTFHDAPRYVRSVAYSPDGKLLATAELDGTAKLRDAETGRVVRVLEDNPRGVNGVSFAPDGRTLATAGLDGVVRIRDVASGEVLREFPGDGSPVYSVAFSPDGRTLASCGDDDKVHLWDARTGASRAVLQGHQDDVESVAFSPDGTLLASTSWDRSVKLWDVEKGREVATLTGHTVPALGAAFSPDGTLLATCGGTWGTFDIGPGRGELKLWDVASRSEQASLDGHHERVFAVAFSPDGRTLASADWEGTVVLRAIGGVRDLTPPLRRPVNILGLDR